MTLLNVGRPRSHGRRDLPDNLIPRPRRVAGREVIYWYWNDPRDGKEKPLKCPDDKETAIRRARELNALVAREQADSIVENLVTTPAKRKATGVPFNAWALSYLSRLEKRLEKGKIAANTLRSRKSLVNSAIQRFQGTPLHEMANDVAAISAFIESIEDAGKGRTAQATRSTLIDIFREAHSSGTLDSNLPNPASLTRPPNVDVQRSRLTLEDYLVIWPACERLGAKLGVWQPNSVLLALVTAQRREDIAIMRFRRGKDWDAAWQAFQRGERHPVHPYPFIEDDMLWIVQQKTGALVRIPLDLKLNAINITVGETVDRCRSSIASRYLLHHTIPFGNAPVGTRIHQDTITRQFSVARDSATLEWVGRTPPTFHELRSLSERLYRDQGVDTQILLGHRHARMTEVYNDARGAEWSTVTA